MVGVADHLILLEGGRSNTERKAIRKQMDEIPDDQIVIVVAINKYVGEGFNYPRLDTMMLTTPFRFEGNGEQYAGRLNRDYVDCHMAMFNRMYHQRMKIYKKIGYKLLQPDRPKQELTQMIYTGDSYRFYLEQDILSANREIIICSPKLQQSKVNTYLELLQPVLERGIHVGLVTINVARHDPAYQPTVEHCIIQLKMAGVQVDCVDQLFEHYVLVDRAIVWYGNADILTKGREDDEMIRIIDTKFAEEQLYVTHINSNNELNYH